jgi:hypothetical protein
MAVFGSFMAATLACPLHKGPESAASFPEHAMSAITHIEVRRHPRWREELNAPRSAEPRHGPRLLGAVALLIVTTALGVLMFNA